MGTTAGPCSQPQTLSCLHGQDALWHCSATCQAHAVTLGSTRSPKHFTSGPDMSFTPQTQQQMSPHPSITHLPASKEGRTGPDCRGSEASKTLPWGLDLSSMTAENCSSWHRGDSSPFLGTSGVSVIPLSWSTALHQQWARNIYFLSFFFLLISFFFFCL